MGSQVGICNRGLQKLGESRIVSMTQDSPTARECNAIYDDLLERELRSHPWKFATKRAALASSGTVSPGLENRYLMPTDCLRILPPNDYDMDWEIEGRYIISSYTAPLYIRYTGQVTDPNQFDALFRDLFSTAIAIELCERITQSNTKKEAQMIDYRNIVSQARRVNAFESTSQEMPVDSWLVARL